MAPSTTSAINRLTIEDKLNLLVFAAVRVPLNIVLALVTKPFSKAGRRKTILRAIADRIILSLVSTAGRRSVRAVFGTTKDNYNAFVKSAKLEPTVEELGEDARLLWLGPKRTDKVILYLHGGAYLFAAPACNFWYLIQKELEKKGETVGCAVLNYSKSFVPDQTFPVQLRQGVAAVQHIINSGVDPRNLVLVGDSAGGAYIHQIISHILHPVDGVPTLKLSAPFGGAYMMSPWVAIAAPKDGSYERMDGKGDILSSHAVTSWGKIVLKDVPPAGLPYVDANQAPIMDGWYDGIESTVRRILVSAGGIECMRDSMVDYYEKLKVKHPDVQIYVEDYGTHNGPYYDVMLGDKRIRDLTKKILDWLHEGFAA